jgi:hypothetical protein
LPSPRVRISAALLALFSYRHRIVGCKGQVPTLDKAPARRYLPKGCKPWRVRRRLFQSNASALPLQSLHYDRTFCDVDRFYFQRSFISQKLIKRTIFTDHLKILTDRQDELLQQLTALTKEGFPKAQEEWEKSVVAWGASLCDKSVCFV